MKATGLATKAVPAVAAPPIKTLAPAAVGALAALAFAALAGLASAAGPTWRLLAVGASGAVLIASVSPAITRRRARKPGRLAVEIPVLVLAVSTLVFRVRSSEDIASNPLDAAGLFRVGCLGLGLLLGGLAFIWPGRDAVTHHPIQSRPFRLYSLYVVAVFVGAWASPDPLLTIFFGMELVAVLLVLRGAVRGLGTTALFRIESALYAYHIVLVLAVWLGVLLSPGRAVVTAHSPLPWQVKGVFPDTDFNGVGSLGVVLTLWSLAYLVGPRGRNTPPRILAASMAFLGFVTLVAAQYRTGYVALALGVMLLLVLRKRRLLAVLALAFGMGAGLWGPAVANRAEPFLLRGETPQEASGLSSRVEWWSLAIPVWKTSPIIGRGLLTATRFDVLNPIGQTETSTIHSTWVEALVGTGLLGAGLLAASFLVLWGRVLGEARRPGGRLVPLLVLTALSVRSLTGTTFEASGRSVLIYLLFALMLSDPRPSWAPRWGSGGLASAARRPRIPTPVAGAVIGSGSAHPTAPRPGLSP